MINLRDIEALSGPFGKREVDNRRKPAKKE
jgi:hypothetical protein